MSTFADFGGSGNVQIEQNGNNVSYRPNINFIPGTNITLTVNDNPAQNRADVTINTGASTGPFEEQYQIVDETHYYRGEAAPGALTSAAVWRIWTVTVSGSIAATQWASGNAGFVNIWDRRTEYQYF